MLAVRPDGRAGNQGKENHHVINQHTKSASATLRHDLAEHQQRQGHHLVQRRPVRSYKKGDETWKETDSLGFDDLLTMAELLRQAFAWIARQLQADSKARKARKEAANAE